MSDSVTDDKPVTRYEFTRLEKKMDRVLRLLEGQLSMTSSRSASSGGLPSGVYDSFEDLVDQNKGEATLLEKDTQKGDKTDDDDEDSFIVLESSSAGKGLQTYVKEPVDSSSPSVSSVTGEETRVKILYSHSTIEDQVRHLTQIMGQLENRLCDRLNDSMKNIMSELQKEMREMIIPGSSSLTVIQEREIVKDIQNMTGHLNLITETIEELKDQIEHAVPSDESSIIANIRAELVWFKENLEETVNSQAVAITQELDKARSSKDFTDKTQATATVMENQVDQILQKVEASSKAFLEEVKASTTAFNQDMRKSTETVTQRIDNVSCNIKQEVKASVTVTPNQVDQILKEVKALDASLSQGMKNFTQAIKQEMDKSSKNVTIQVQESADVIAEQAGQMLKEVKASNTCLSQDMKTSIEEIKQEVDKSSKTVTQKIQDSATVMTNHFSHVLQEVNTSNTAVSLSVQKSTETMRQDLNKSQLDVVQKLQTSSSSVHKKLDQSFHDVKASVTTSRQRAVGEIQKTVESLGHRMERNVEGIQNTVKLQDGNMEKNMAEVQRTVKTYGETIKKNIDGIQKTVESHGEKMKKNLQDSLNQQSQNTRTHVDTKMTENTKQLKDNMYKLKREIFAFTEKECQIVRDRIEGPLPSHKLYTLDFYVEDFKDLIKSGVERYSPPWHINQFKSSIQGWVTFLTNGNLKVWMNNCRHPREVGLQTRQSGEVKMKATISDASGKLADMKVRETTGNFNEVHIKSNGEWGHGLGEIDCQRIVDAGYADIQNYINGAVLVRYVVEVL